MNFESKGIILMLLFTGLFINISVTDNVDGLQALNVGDQFLYTNDRFSMQRLNDTILVQNSQYGHESYKHEGLFETWVEIWTICIQKKMEGFK
ncbi:MAG: hypothetical protein ACTSYD_06910 [Candidatus Heimdallarchaeaceae archaeon]